MRHSQSHHPYVPQTRTLLDDLTPSNGQFEGQKLRGRLRRSRILVAFLGVMVFVLLGGNIFQLALWSKQPEIKQALLSETHRNQLAHQDQLARLKVEIERLRSRQVANKGTLNLQFQQIYNQQVQLARHQNYVKSLAMMASELGIGAAQTAQKPIKATIAPSMSLSSVQNDRGEIDPTIMEYDLIRMQDESLLAVTALSEQISAKTRLAEKALKRLNIRVPKLPNDQQHQLSIGMGGPFVPLDDIATPENTSLDQFSEAARSVLQAMDRLKSIKKTVAKFPLHKPIRGKNVRSSGYGPRQDPFLNKRSFHAGVDFSARTGTPVYAAANGKVIFAGRRGGYGNLVEIRHANGYTTRYAHLSSISTKLGAWVSPQTRIGRVGSTGRSTGPHLHYEVRVSDKHKNPTPYMQTGVALKKADLL